MSVSDSTLLNINVDYYKAVCFQHIKLHQNVWQLVSELCMLRPPGLGNPREEMEKRMNDGGREVSSGLDPQDLLNAANLRVQARFVVDSYTFGYL